MTSLTLIQLLLLSIGTLILAYFSRDALRAPGSHGFYRFFAWECMLGALALNLGYWFRDAFSPIQIVSWVLLMASALLVASGVWQLRRQGQPGHRDHAEDLHPLERTTKLVTTGVYRYIRHPLYSSLLCLVWGIFLKHPAWLPAILTLSATVLLVATARADEAECREFFGEAYAEYMRKTRMFVPYVF